MSEPYPVGYPSIPNLPDPNFVGAQQRNTDDLRMGIGVAQGAAAAAAARTWIPTVTSLPGSPINGQECFYVADATNGRTWHLKYRSAASGSYKWDVVGGSPLTKYRVGGHLVAADGQYDYINFTLPLAGDYLLGCDILGSSVVAAQYFTGTLKVDSLGTVDPAFGISYSAGYSTTTGRNNAPFVGVATADTARLMLFASNDSSFTYGALFAMPVRVG